MCDQNGPCQRGRDLQAMGAKVAHAIKLALQDDRMGGLDHMRIIARENEAAGLMVCMCLAETAAKLFPTVMGVPAGQPGYTIQAVNPSTGADADIDSAPPGPVFAVRFIVAYCNGDYEMCGALFAALVTHEDETALSSGMAFLFDNAVGFTRELLVRGGVSQPPR